MGYVLHMAQQTKSILTCDKDNDLAMNDLFLKEALCHLGLAPRGKCHSTVAKVLLVMTNHVAKGE